MVNFNEFIMISCLIARDNKSTFPHRSLPIKQIASFLKTSFGVYFCKANMKHACNKEMFRPCSCECMCPVGNIKRSIGQYLLVLRSQSLWTLTNYRSGDPQSMRPSFSLQRIEIMLFMESPLFIAIGRLNIWSLDFDEDKWVRRLFSFCLWSRYCQLQSFWSLLW